MKGRGGPRWLVVGVFAVVHAIVTASCSSSPRTNSTFNTNFDASGGGDSTIALGPDGGNGGCQPQTCSTLGYTCGENGDGCGGMIQCGSCMLPAYCGGGGYSQCGGNVADAPDGAPLCAPATCESLKYTCGPAGDGCGNLIQCGTSAGCSFPEFCGGAGFDQCGGSTATGVDGGALCTPTTCKALGYTCGAAADGCGNLLECGTCAAPQFCGGGGFNQCGAGDLDAGVSTCTPATCTSQGFTCGSAGDGCGNSLSCGTCSSPQFCGGGGFNVCGGNGVATGAQSACVPDSCTSLGYSCGYAGDGCGNQLACGMCSSPDYCGGGGFDQCGYTTSDAGFSCMAATCTSLGYDCGYAADGCNGLLQCGATCPSGTTCGGGGQRNVCGTPVPCTNLCLQQAACGAGSQTMLTGTVVASTPSMFLPTGVAYGDPVPNVLVYIPNSAVQPFVPRSMETPAQQCSTCGADVSGSPLVQTTTSFDGTFTLSNVPVGSTIPVVIQLGRWRRQFTVSVGASCGPNTVNDPTMPAGILMMPSKQSEGDIPLTAISTGQLDAMECVLLKMGVDPMEFTINTSTYDGRVHIYDGNGATASVAATTPGEPVLMGSSGTFNNYDQIIFPCWGVDPTTFESTNAKSATELANLVTYANAGGHFFATHYSYSWLYNNSPFSMTAQWDVDADQNITTTTGVVSQAVPPLPVSTPGVFVEWLNYIKALDTSTAPPPPNPADVTITSARHDVDAVLGQSSAWITGTDLTPKSGSPPEMLLHYTFDTPVGQASQCGHAIFSDFHVTNQSNTSLFSFPADSATECGSSPMTAQEKILEYMIWDLASCVVSPPQPTCTPLSCSDQNITCGPAGDGCGAQITNGCGTCTLPETCGGGGVFGQCGVPPGPCTKSTCTAQNITCGPAGDGCGGLITSCGMCPAGQTCGGGGTKGQCGAPPSTTACTPSSCMQQNITCGPAGDGCGGSIATCGMCALPQTCGGGGTPGQCGMGTCTPTTCQALGFDCGPAGDGCGGELQCGQCPAGEICGGSGKAGRCSMIAQ